MPVLASFWMVIIGIVLAAPIIAVVSIIQTLLLRNRVNALRKELEKVSRATETTPWDSLQVRIRRLEERFDSRFSDPVEKPQLEIEKPAEFPVASPVIGPEQKGISAHQDPFVDRPQDSSVPSTTSLSVVSSSLQKSKRPSVDWEKFTAGKLMSWIGGFALFLGAIFFAKYSFDHGFISPALRVALGFAAGTAAIVAGLKMRTRYEVTAQTLSASGAAILYAVAFAAHSLYGFLGPTETFSFLSLVTVLAFLLSMRLNSHYIAVLALVGGFLVPPLISTGVDRPFGLFAYVTLLDVGLLALVAARGWGFLWGFGVAGTALMMVGWWNTFYVAEKTLTATVMCLWFTFFFAGARAWIEKRVKEESWTVHGAGVISLVSILLGALALFHYHNETPLPAFLILIGADLVTAWLAVRSGKFQHYHLAAGGLIFIILLGWTQGMLTPTTLPETLGAYLVFGGLHGALSFVLNRRGAPKGAVVLGHLFPVALLLPLMLGLLKEIAAPGLVWPVIFGLNAVALLAAVATGFLWAALGALVMTFITVGVWIPRLMLDNMVGLLVVIGATAGLFSWAGYLFMKRVSSPSLEKEGVTSDIFWTWPDPWKILFPALSSILPFFLLAFAAGSLRPENPGGLFGLAGLLAFLLVGLVKAQAESVGVLGVVALAGVAMVQYAWQGTVSSIDSALWGLPWFTAFAVAFIALPFVFPKRFGSNRWFWIASALSGPLHFLLFYRSANELGLSSHMGVLPLVWGAVSLGTLVRAVRTIPQDSHRQGLLALFGAVCLLFISLIFPLQFEKQWITLGWALEGVALLWLHRRIPHIGLKIGALALLTIAFARLTLNPAVFSYYPREGTKIFNWYLYAYGVVVLCQFSAARFWPKEADSTKPHPWVFLLANAKSITTSFGAILLFLLMNIEIADYFSSGTAIMFDLRGSLSQDLATTLGWGLFGFCLLLAGLFKRNTPARWGGLSLLGVTVGKLFLHDVWRLPLLFRSTAFAGLALILIAGSFFFQRFQNKSSGVRP